MLIVMAVQLRRLKLGLISFITIFVVVALFLLIRGHRGPYTQDVVTLKSLGDIVSSAVNEAVKYGRGTAASKTTRHEKNSGEHEYILRDLTRLSAVRELAGSHTKWDDPALIHLISQQVLDPPRPHVTKLSFPLFETPQAKAVGAILNSKKSGFFVECGALDGERSSNTIWLEKKRGWTGLLVEMDPSYYLQIRGKNRKAYSSNVCLSPETYPTIVDFKEHNQGSGRLAKDTDPADILMPTFCVPLYSLMLAMNRTKIDYFSLDVEGFEMPILRSIPYDKLDISVLTVEYNHGKEQQQEGENDYVNFMDSKGYKVHSKIDKIQANINLFVHDYVFVKKQL